MIYLFYGPNEYGRRHKLNAFCDAVKIKAPQAAIQKFSLDEEGEIERLYDFIVPKSLFESAKRVAIINNSKSVSDDDIFRRIILLLATDKESVLVFNEEWEPKEILKSINDLKAQNGIKEFYFEKLTDAEVKRAALRELKAGGILMDSSAVDYLLGIFNKNLFAFMNEAEKLSFVGGLITKKMLQEMDEYQQDKGIYEFSSAVAYGAELKERMSLWEQLVHQKTDNYIVLNYLAKAVKNLSLIKKIADIDVGIKTGLLEPDQAILNMLLS